MLFGRKREEALLEVIEELRGEFRSMEASNATPEEFGLKVRSHPDTLIVTARNKMGTGAPVVVRIGLANSLIETHTLRRDEESLGVNREAARRLSHRLGQGGFPIETAERADFGWLLRGVPVGPVLNFLTEFRNHEGGLLTSGDPVRRYIEERRDDELAKWDVLFASVFTETNAADTSLGRRILRQRRTEGGRSDARTLLVGNRQRASSRGIDRTGLTSEQRSLAEEEYRKGLESAGRLAEGRSIEFPDLAYRKMRTRPLLMVHLIDIITIDPGDSLTQPVVAWGISFPATQREEKRVEYVVNTTWFRENFREDVDEEEMQGDDG